MGLLLPLLFTLYPAISLSQENDDGVVEKLLRKPPYLGSDNFRQAPISGDEVLDNYIDTEADHTNTGLDINIKHQDSTTTTPTTNDHFKDSYYGDDLNLLLLVTPLPSQSRKIVKISRENPPNFQDKITQFPTTPLPKTLQILLQSEPNDYDFIPASTDFDKIDTFEIVDPLEDIAMSDDHLTPPFDYEYQDENNILEVLEERKQYLHKQSLKEKSHKSRKGFHLPRLMNDPLLNLLAYGTALGAAAQGLGLVPFDIIHFDIKKIRKKRYKFILSLELNDCKHNLYISL